MSKIVRTESRASSLLKRFAEVMPILCKDSTSPPHNKNKTEKFLSPVRLKPLEKICIFAIAIKQNDSCPTTRIPTRT